MCVFNWHIILVARQEDFTTYILAINRLGSFLCSFSQPLQFTGHVCLLASIHLDCEEEMGRWGEGVERRHRKSVEEMDEEWLN